MNIQTEMDRCVAVLKAGGLILYPTDTIWGIGCDAANEQAVKKIYNLKKREEKKSMIILLSDKNDVPLYAKAPSDALLTELSASEKPLTVIYPGAKNLASNLINQDGTIAIRIVKNKFCNDMIKAFGKPVISTSANISGEKYPENFSEISQHIIKGVDYTVRLRQEETGASCPSRIIKWTEENKVIVIRE